jgi:ketosteroid isomerase-like protein
MVLSRIAHKLISYNMRRLNAGDPGPTLRLDADDVTFTFPGDSSWAGVYRGKQELRPWLERFVRVGLQIFADEVVVQGFPWRQTVCIRGHDYLPSSSGELVYENRYVIWGHLRWGRLKQYEVFEDTQKAKALDEYLATLTSSDPSVRPVLR